MEIDFRVLTELSLVHDLKERGKDEKKSRNRNIFHALLNAIQNSSGSQARLSIEKHLHFTPNWKLRQVSL